MKRDGPAAITAIDKAVQSEFCQWWIPQSDGSTSLFVAELPEEVRDDLQAALRGPYFIESELSGSPIFVWENPAARFGPRFVWYGFTGDVLVASLSLNQDGGIAEVTLATMR